MINQQSYRSEEFLIPIPRLKAEAFISLESIVKYTPYNSKQSSRQFMTYPYWRDAFIHSIRKENIYFTFISISVVDFIMNFSFLHDVTVHKNLDIASQMQTIFKSAYRFIKFLILKNKQYWWDQWLTVFAKKTFTCFP